MTKYEITIEISQGTNSWNILKSIIKMARTYNLKFTWKKIESSMTYSPKEIPQ